MHSVAERMNRLSVRPVLDLIPATRSQFLIIGAGADRIKAQLLLRKPTAQCHAVEAATEADLTSANFPAGPYDVVVLMNAAPRDPRAALSAMGRLVDTDGVLIAQFAHAGHWQRMRDLREGTDRADSLARFSQREVAALVVEAGLKPERLRPIIDTMPEGDLPDTSTVAQMGNVDDPAVRHRLRTLGFIVSARPERAARSRQLRVHMAHLVPRLMDVRTTQPATALMAEPTLHVTSSERDLFIPTGDPGVLVIQRPRVGEPERMVRLVSRAQARGWVVVLEYDDDPLLVARVRGMMNTPEIYHDSVGCVHAVQTSTPALGQLFGRLNPETRVFPNAVPELGPVRTPHGRPFHVVFAALNRLGTEPFAKALATTIRAHPQVRFSVVRNRLFFDALPTDNKRFMNLLRYPDYIRLLGDVDVALSPLLPDIENLGKSDVKWVEAASRGAVMIASPTVYAATIRHGENGLLANTPEEFAQQLAELVSNHDLRRQIADRARRDVSDSRLLWHQTVARRDWYRDLFARRNEVFAAALARSPRLAEAVNQAQSDMAQGGHN
ncbi:MAG: hypothetical protein DI498_07885 [Paracoccus denitrificans]|nr:MAG: hypothetical protein DI498_07885 [Paracoccus denitrificans]PZO84442.1 MAG: hypothetical protein DI633_07885 [Paracoccus denitrificans]